MQMIQMLKETLFTKESICSFSKGMTLDRAESSCISQMDCTTMHREMWSSLKSL